MVNEHIVENKSNNYGRENCICMRSSKELKGISFQNNGPEEKTTEEE